MPIIVKSRMICGFDNIHIPLLVFLLVYHAAYSQSGNFTTPMLIVTEFSLSTSFEVTDISDSRTAPFPTVTESPPHTPAPTMIQVTTSPTQGGTTPESIFDFFGKVPTGLMMVILLAMASAWLVTVLLCFIVVLVSCIVCYRHGKRKSQPKSLVASSINPYFQENSHVPDPIYELEEKDTTKLVITE